MSRPRPLLIPWLREKIDSGRYPGVHWMNEERVEFCIPWKHALRQDNSDTDVLIFKAWAEVSGNGQAQGEPAVWKRNFRSALRAKGFKMVADNKNDAANPHKVFRWPEEAAAAARANSSAGSPDQDDPDILEELALPVQETQAAPCIEDVLYLPEEDMFTGESTIDQDILHMCLKDLNIGPVTEDTAGFKPPPEQQQHQNQVVIGGQALPGQQQYPVMSEVAVGEAGLPGQPAHPIEGAVGGACGEELGVQTRDTMSKDGNHFKTHFKVTVFYRGTKVSEQLVKNEAGIRLVYRPELGEPTLDHESGLSLVSLPRPGAMLDQTQARLTQRILDNLGRGLDVGVSGHVIYGQRRGEIKGFWSFSKFDNGREPQEISKQPQPLYLFKDFLQGILDFLGGKECSPCSLFLCLGEKWPDSRPWEKKLITVEVALTSMELLKNMAVEGGASSLRSVELQMSLEEMMMEIG